MELQLGKKYKIKLNNRVADIEVLKKNKRNYRVLLDGCHEILWQDKNGNLYFRVLKYDFDKVKLRNIKQIEKIMIVVLEA